MHLLGIVALALIPLTASSPNTLEVPSISLQAPVVSAQRVALDNRTYTWTVPCSFSASSIMIGGNTTLFGHRDICGGVFDHLPQLVPGDDVFYSGHRYVVSETDIVSPVEWWPIQDSGDQRLTLISCWPPGSTAQRYVVVALQVPGDAPAPADGPPVQADASALAAGPSVTGDASTPTVSSPVVGNAPAPAVSRPAPGNVPGDGPTIDRASVGAASRYVFV